MESDVSSFLSLLPKYLLSCVSRPDELLEVVLDLGRPFEARYPDGAEVITDMITGNADLAFVCDKVGRFGSDNRAGLDGSLHRISRIMDRYGRMAGLTLRLGRPYYGSVALIEDGVIDSGASVLLLGRPGAGKSTKLRDAARHLADASKRVIIVDSSNEIAGDGVMTHPAVGRARRMQVPIGSRQSSVMIEAVKNHTPEIIVIDEISTRDEADAAATIAQRGVRLIATAHGNTIHDLLKNRPLVRLIGGVSSVTLSDSVAAQRGSAKTVRERSDSPVFDILVEIEDFETVSIYTNVSEAVDCLLSGGSVFPERRKLCNGSMRIIAPYRAMFPDHWYGYESDDKGASTSGH